jgi:GR25 family glycosyltransferase involved in LPS biosynthesis
MLRDFPNCSDWHLGLSYSELRHGLPPPKTRLFSAVVSSRYTSPGHVRRVDFLKFLEHAPDAPPLDIFGFDNAQNFAHYRRPLPDRRKADGLLPYRYTFNAENQSLPNYFTEKILDAVLAETLCFYWGCPNLDEYLDPQAFIRLDLDDPPSALRTIRTAIAADEWSRHLPVLRREKRRILDELQLFPTLERFVHEQDLPAFIVNLDRRPDRWQAVRRQIYPHWEHFTRFPAVDGRLLRLSPAQRRLFAGNHFGDRRAVMACALSQLALWEQLAHDRRFRRYLILEDDVTLCANFASQLQRLMIELEGKAWDMVFLGAHVWRERRDPRLYVDQADGLRLSPTLTDWFGGNFAYLISQDGAQKLLELAQAQGMPDPIDIWLIHLAGDLDLFFTQPHLAFSEYFAGDEVGSRVDSDIQLDFEKVD